VLAEEEYFDRLGQLPDVEGEVYDDAAKSRATLMRSAGVPPGEVFARETHEGALELADERLKRFGCDFIKASYLLMGALEMPGDARDFVIIVMAASGGTRRRLIIKDEKLAELSGYTDRTIRTKRKAYLEWEASEKGWTAVRVIEQKFDPTAGQTPPTEYEVPFTDALIVALREWRTYYQQQLNQYEPPDRGGDEPPALWEEMREERRRSAFAESTRPEVFTEIAHRVIPDKLACEPSERRREQDGRRIEAPPQQTRDRLSANDARILMLIAENRDLARKRGQGAYSWFQDLKRKAAIVLAERTPGFPDPDEEE
jgi:hypothetical protein